MNFKKLLMKYMPTLSKKYVLQEVNLVIEYINDSSYPLVEKCIESLDMLAKKNVPPSPSQIVYEQRFRSKFKKEDPYKHLLKSLRNAEQVLQKLLKDIDETFAEDITRSSLSLYNMNVLNLVNAADVIAVYPVVVMSVIFREHCGEQPPPSTYNLFNKVAFDFLYLVELFEKEPDALIRELKKLPTAPATEEMAGDRSIINGINTDPLKMNFIAPRFNPFMLAGNMVVEYQTSKYKKVQADYKEIQCRILHLKQKLDGRQDAKLEKQIDYYTNLSIKLSNELAELEEEYGLKD